MGDLVLSVPWVGGRDRWRWLLSEAGSGAPLADFEAWFPDEPHRFVGRTGAMAAATAALAPESSRTAVLLHGMAGAGKTACAVELAYRHETAFTALAFWQAPTRGEEWPTALTDLAQRLESQLREDSPCWTRSAPWPSSRRSCPG